jgi:hypothetical protein
VLAALWVRPGGLKRVGYRLASKETLRSFTPAEQRNALISLADQTQPVKEEPALLATWK